MTTETPKRIDCYPSLEMHTDHARAKFAAIERDVFSMLADNALFRSDYAAAGLYAYMYDSRKHAVESSTKLQEAKQS